MNKRKADEETSLSSTHADPAKRKRCESDKNSSPLKKIDLNRAASILLDQSPIKSELDESVEMLEVLSAPNTPVIKSQSATRRSGSLQPYETRTSDGVNLSKRRSLQLRTPKQFHRSPGRISDIRNFLIHAKNINWYKPKNAFLELNGARLCGFFDNIDIDDNCVITDRPQERCISYKFNDDLPEMTTCCRYKEGRYAIWRDDPNCDDIYIVHVTQEEHFPCIQVIGDRMEHILYHLAKKDHELLKKLLPKDYSFAKINREVHAAVRERNRIKLGGLPTGTGIWIPLKDGEEHIEIGHGAELKKVIMQIGEDNKSIIMRAEDQMIEVYAAVDQATDEGFFGMSLELGHWLWLANYRCLMEKAKEYLIAAYTYLGRDEYVNIVETRYSKKTEAWTKQETKALPAYLRLPQLSLKDAGPKYLTRTQVKNIQ